jgi:hypothetical protein
MAGEIVLSEPAAQPGKALTDRQKRLVDAILAGKSDQEAWEAADYGNSVSFRNAMRSGAVQAALLEGRRAFVGGSLATKALAAIETLVTSDKTPAATRLAASKWVLEQTGFTAKGDEGQDKPLHEMTESELARFMQRAQAVVDGGGEPPIISVTPDNGA